jgi:hypothetical protein
LTRGRSLKKRQGKHLPDEGGLKAEVQKRFDTDHGGRHQ